MNRSDIEQLPLCAYRISNGALTSAPTLPTRLKLLSWGNNPSTQGPVRIGEKTARIIPQIQPLMGFAKVALDFEHNTVPGTPAYKESKEPRPVAAYGVPKIVPGEGLFLEDLEWTPDGKVAAFNFADLSPAVKQDANGEVLFIHSAALTRNGSVHELSFYSANQKEETKMDTFDPNKHFTVSELGAALGLTGTPDKAAVLGSLSKFCATLAVLSALTAEKDGKAVLVIGAGDVQTLSAGLGKITGLEARLKIVEDTKGADLKVFSATVDGKTISIPASELAAKIVNLETQFAANGLSALSAQKDGIIRTFATDGKVPVNHATGKAYSDAELKGLPVEMLQMLSANTPVTVPLSARARGNGGGGTTVDPKLKGLSKVSAAWDVPAV